MESSGQGGGLEVLRFEGGKGAVLTSVELVDADGMEIVGVKLAGAERDTWSIQRIAWPPRDRELPPESVMPAFSAPLKPTSETDYELLLGIRATREGYLVRRGLQVGYTVEGKEYSDFVPAILAICTSPDLEDEHGWCPLPEEWSELKDS